MKRLTAALMVVVLLAAGCDITDLIQQPGPGSIVPGPTVEVSGSLPERIALGGTLRVNGIDTTINPDRTWTAQVPVDSGSYVTVVEAIYTATNGIDYRQQQVVVTGPKLDEGQLSPEGVGMHFTNTGLAGLGPVIRDLASGAFDIGALLLAQNPLIEEEDAFLTIDITGNAYEAGVGAVSLDAASTPAGVATDITIEDLYVGVDLNLDDGLLIDLDCSLELQLPETSISATFDLQPSAADPRFVDVNLVGTPVVDTGAVEYEFISGVCDSDAFLIGDIVNLVAGPQVEGLIGAGFATQLGDPDGSGPLDSPIADAIETALAEISISGAVGEAIHANLDAPFTQINEGGDAIDFRADADFFPTFGAGPTDCQPVAGSPDLPSTFDVPGAYPTLGATTPSGSPYGLGLVISASAFNQLLGALTECGILTQEITEISLGGPPLPITSSVLSFLVPQFGTKLPANTPMVIRLRPSYSPFLTSQPGPGGETGELMLADLQIEFVEPGVGPNGRIWLVLGVDAPLGFDLAFDAAAGALAPTITPPAAAAVDARVLKNMVGADEAAVEAVFPNLFPTFAGSLSSSFGAFPLPAFLGLGLNVLEVARQGNHFVLYANLDPVPQTRIDNVAVTDLSSGDSVTDSILDVNEWRHRIRPSASPNQVRVDFKGMIGADACCATGDEERTAHAGYRVTLDVVPENAESWQLDLSQLIQGAHTLYDEQNGSSVTRFDTPVTGRARIGAGAWQAFDVTPSATSASTGNSGDRYVPFTGSNALVLSGDTAQTITVEFGFNLFARSESNLIFPIASGDEAAIRFGANDTIVNGFSAGGYPGTGGRNIVTDGHFATINLTAVP